MSDFDIEALSASRKMRAERIGRGFASGNVLVQGKETLLAYGIHGEKLAAVGFTPAQKEELEACTSALEQAILHRLDTKDEGKGTAKVLAGARSGGKQARLVAKAVVEGALVELRHSSDPAVLAAVGAAEGTLGGLRSTGADSQHLLIQLHSLQNALKLEPIATHTAAAGGPQALAMVTAAIAEIRKAESEHRKGIPTTEEQRRIDVLDGLVVEWVRLARKAARAAATLTGDSSIAKAFELDHLYG